MAIPSSLLPTTQTTSKPHNHNPDPTRRRKKKKPHPLPPPPKPPSSWAQLKNLLTCRSVNPAQVCDPSAARMGSSCRNICSVKDVIHGTDGVVHRDQDCSPGSSTRLLSARGHRSSSKAVQFRKFSGCYECHAVSDPIRYPMSRMIRSCPECGEVFTKPENLELHQILRHGVSELGPEDSSRNILEIIFKSSWNKKTPPHADTTPPPLFKIERILKVHNTARTIARFESHRNTIKSQAARNPRCAADGNELLRFHCTTLACPLGLHGSTSLCSGFPLCGVCTAIRGGLGRGARTTASSGMAHCGVEGLGRRAMLVCRVIAGRVRRDGEEDGGGDGYDSVAGGGGNVEELVVVNPRAVLACFVVVYRTLE